MASRRKLMPAPPGPVLDLTVDGAAMGVPSKVRVIVGQLDGDAPQDLVVEVTTFGQTYRPVDLDLDGAEAMAWARSIIDRIWPG